MSIGEDGKIELRSHIKLNKPKRDIRHYALIEHEYLLRMQLDSPRVLAPGNIYVYKSKLGVEKMSWVCPFYNKTALDVLPAYLEDLNSDELILLRPKLPFYTIELCLDMALCLKDLHSKNYVHRDIKLENFLVDFDLEAKKVKSCVVSDLAFCGFLEQFNDDKKNIEAKLWSKSFPKKRGDIKKANQKFASLCKEGSFPSLDEYKKKYEDDPDGVDLLEFLTKLDQYLIVGTPGHIAPEVYSQRTYSEITDLYSLGYAFFNLKEQAEAVTFFPSSIEGVCSKLIDSLISTDPGKRPDLDTVIKTLETMLRKKK